MGLTYRIFLIDDNDSIKKISNSRFQRLMNREPYETFPEHASKRVKYALVILKVEGRDPIRIIDIEYSVLPFDKNGRIDAKERGKQLHSAMNCLGSPDVDKNKSNVINAQDKFAKRTYNHFYKWTPKPKVVNEIVRLIFG